MAEHSDISKAWSTKLKRIGEKASREPKTVFNNIGHIIDRDMLRAHYQRLDGKKAAGIDGVTKSDYGKRLEGNLEDLLIRIRRGTYRPQPSRMVEIPKEDGSMRPLAISSLEDKIVQSCVNTILTKLYEPLFLDCSFGGRPGKSAHGALKELMKAASRAPAGYVVEVDVQKYFDTIPHEVLMECLEKRISDRRFLGLIRKLLQAPKWIEERAEKTQQGCPQGSIISPILANLYLHEVIDSWFEETRRTHLRGDAEMVRYLDDMVFVFTRKRDAERFYKALPKRLEKYGLKLHEGKSSLIPGGRNHAKEAEREGRKLLTFKFLGFVAYWGKSRWKDFWRLKYRSRGDRMQAKLKRMRTYLWARRAVRDVVRLLKTCAKGIRGWINYHGISDNGRQVRNFLRLCKRLIFSWLNSRGSRKTVPWEKASKLFERSGFPERYKTKSMFDASPNREKS